MKQHQVPAEGAYVEDDADAARELDAGAAPFNKEAPGDEDDEVERGIMGIPLGAGDLLSGGGEEKAGPGTEEWATEEMTEPEHENTTKYHDDWDEDPDERAAVMATMREDGQIKAVNGACTCGADAPPGANFCPGCGGALNGGTGAEEKIVYGDDCDGDDNADPDCRAMFHAVSSGKAVPGNGLAQSTDPATDEILERYRVPKSNRWATRKWVVARALLPFLKHRVAANGKKYLVRAKQEGGGTAPGGVVAGPAPDGGAVKSLTTKLAGAIDDLKALVKAPDMPKHHQAGLKHVADSIWHVGKALTDKGKEQRDGGAGRALSDKGKRQRNPGTGGDDSGSGWGGELGGSRESMGAQQGKNPTKGAARQVSPAVEQKFRETLAKLRRHGVLNGSNGDGG